MTKFSKIALAAALVAAAGAASAQVDLDSLLSGATTISDTTGNSVTADVAVQSVCSFTAGTLALQAPVITKYGTNGAIAISSNAAKAGTVFTSGFSKLSLKSTVTPETGKLLPIGSGTVTNYATIGATTAGGTALTSGTTKVADGTTTNAVEHSLTSAGTDVYLPKIASISTTGFSNTGKLGVTLGVSCVN